MNGLPKLMCPHRWSILETASSCGRHRNSMRSFAARNERLAPVGRRVSRPSGTFIRAYEGATDAPELQS
jgi:hypothetical protein